MIAIIISDYVQFVLSRKTLDKIVFYTNSIIAIGAASPFLVRVLIILV